MQMVKTTPKKLTSAGTVGLERRTLPAVQRLSEDVRNSIHQHIGKFPTRVVCVYCEERAQQVRMTEEHAWNKLDDCCYVRDPRSVSAIALNPREVPNLVRRIAKNADAEIRSVKLIL